MLDLAKRKPEESGYLLEAERAVGTTLTGEGVITKRWSISRTAFASTIRPDTMCIRCTSPRIPGSPACYGRWCHSGSSGYPERAIKRSDYALALATDLHHAFTLSFAAAFAAWVRVFCRDWPAAKQYAENAIRICSDHGFLLWLAVSTVFHGRALVKCGDPDTGIPALRLGIASYRRTGAQIAVPQLLSQLAESHLELNQLDEGRAVLQEAIDTAQQNDESASGKPSWCVSQGDFLLAGEASEGQRGRAIPGSRGRRAPPGRQSLELRGLMSLVDYAIMPTTARNSDRCTIGSQRAAPVARSPRARAASVAHRHGSHRGRSRYCPFPTCRPP